MASIKQVITRALPGFTSCTQQKAIRVSVSTVHKRKDMKQVIKHEPCQAPHPEQRTTSSSSSNKHQNTSTVSVSTAGSIQRTEESRAAFSSIHPDRS
jgi:hypothetical protein